MPEKLRLVQGPDGRVSWVPEVLKPPDWGKLAWGPYVLPPQAANEHFLFVGSTGSGKSVLIQMLLRSALSPHKDRPENPPALVYDSKGELQWKILFLLWDLGYADAERQEIVPLFEKVVWINPFDRNGSPWAIGKDVTSPATARQIATTLIPDPSGGRGREAEAFFVEASRELTTAAMLALSHSPKGQNWTLRDLLLLTLSPDDLSRCLQASGIHTARRVELLYLSGADVRTRANILSTLSAKLGVYEPVAASWHRSKREPISIREWAKSEKCLILGNDESARASIDPILRAIFLVASEALLSGPEVSPSDMAVGTGRKWIFLDEFREAGKLEGLRSLLNKGRSKGVCVVLGCQDIEGVRDVYGREQANELLGQCAHVAVLNIGSNPDTAEWASNLFGSEDVTVASSGSTVGGQYSENRNEKPERKTLVTTRELVTMPKISPSQGLSGYYKSPIIESSAALADVPQICRIAPWRYGEADTYTWEAAIRPKLPPFFDIVLSRIRDLRPSVPAEDQYLRPWSAEERRALLGPDRPDSPDRPAREPGSKPPGKPPAPSRPKLPRREDR